MIPHVTTARGNGSGGSGGSGGGSNSFIVVYFCICTLNKKTHFQPIHLS